MKKRIYKFCIFILSHNRPDNVITYKNLRKHGYTGEIYIIIDNEDKTIERYKERYKDQIIVFDKKEIAKKIDMGDNFQDMRSVLYARNACWKIARELGYKYFVQLDDDYRMFHFRLDNKLRFKGKNIKDLDRIYQIYFKYFDTISAYSICFAQGGDFIGGKETDKIEKNIKIKRKAMNSFLLSTDREFEFRGIMNDDVNTYCWYGNTGKLFFTIYHISIEQEQSQQNSGGLTELYLDKGTYVKSFYSILYCPSFIKIKLMGRKFKRLHHFINWNNAVPCILREKYKKNSKKQDKRR